MDKETLYRLYIEENMSAKELAKYLNIGIKQLYEILKSFKIKKSPKLIYQVRKRNYLEKYGVENPFQLDAVKAKAKQTNIEKYGSTYFQSTDAFVQKVKETKLKKYGSSNYNNINKAINTNYSKYGCKFKSMEHYNEEQLEFWENMKNKDFLQNYIIEHKVINIKELVKLSGIKYNTVRYYVEKYDLYGLFNYWVSKPEKEIRDFVNQFSPTINNSRKIIPPYELDIFIPLKNIAIEFNGDYWHSTPAVQKKDKLKKEICKERGIKLLVVLESEWNKNKYKVLENIKREIV